MRVIAGEAKGRRLKYPEIGGGKRVRPLSDQAKESLFNILARVIEGSRFLDLFAGSGQVGIEALSRGAELAFFVELDRKAAAIIKQNLETCGFEDRAEIFNTDVMKSISHLGRKSAQFDVVFMGAPYTVPVLIPALEKAAESGIVKYGGIVVAEHSSRQTTPEKTGDLVRFREARYGDTVFSLYRREKIENSGLSGQL